MAKKDKIDDDSLHRIALEQFKRGLDADKDNRDASLEDAKFCIGEQWPDEIRQAREKEGRPCIVVNRMPMFVRQVANEVRMKPPSIQVIPTEDGDIETANVLEGLIRTIEARSKAKRVYSRGIEDAARCNMGYMRVKTQYVSDDSFDQELIIEAIDNPLSVIFDPDALDPMLKDAKFCHVIESMTKSAFKDLYGEDAVSGISGDTTTDVTLSSMWFHGDKVQVAEYIYCVETDSEIVLLEDGKTMPIGDYEKEMKAYQELLMMGSELPPKSVAVLDDKGKPKIRKVKAKKYYSRIMSGAGFLTEPTELVFKRIPIIPVWGEEFRVGDIKVRKSVISNAKDAQRSLNYWRSAAVESMALAPKAPWLVTPTHIKDNEAAWKAAATGNPAVLIYNHDPQAPAPNRIAPPPVNSAMLQEVQMSQDDLKATTGIFDASIGAQSNETSGKAIMARQREGDISTYVFLDNLLAAIEEVGRVILSAIPKVYDTARQIRILGKKNESQVVQVNQINGFDLTNDGYDINISTGASVTTQREEAANAFIEALRSAPQLAPVLLPRLFDNMDINDSKEIAQEIKQMMGAQQQTQQPAPPPQNPKDIATAEKTKAETIGITLDNEAKFQSLHLNPINAGYSPQY